MSITAENIANFRAHQSMSKEEADEIDQDGWEQIPFDEWGKDPFVVQVHAIGDESRKGRFYAPQVVGVLSPEGKIDSDKYASLISNRRANVTALPKMSLVNYRSLLDSAKSEVDSLGEVIGDDAVHKKNPYYFGTRPRRP